MKIIVGFLLFVFFASMTSTTSSITSKRLPLLLICAFVAFAVTRRRFI